VARGVIAGQAQAPSVSQEETLDKIFRISQLFDKTLCAGLSSERLRLTFVLGFVLFVRNRYALLFIDCESVTSPFSRSEDLDHSFLVHLTQGFDYLVQ